MNSIEAAIQQAQEAASRISHDAQQAMVPAGNTGGAVGATMQRGVPLGFDDLSQGELNVVSWLKVNQFGITVGQDKTLFETLDVVIPLSEVAYCYQIRFGNPAQYFKTHDRVSESRTGRSWIEVVSEAKRVDPNAFEYRSADVPFYATKDIKAKGGSVLVRAGEAVGHTLAVTGWKEFASFVSKLKNDGVDITSAFVKIELGFVSRKNDKGEWGILTYNNPEVVADLPSTLQ